MTNAWGDPTITCSHSVGSINSSASAVALAANNDRQYALFINDSSNTIWITVATSTGAATANSGIRLNSDGGSWEMSARIGNLDTRTVHALASASTGNKLLVTTNAT